MMEGRDLKGKGTERDDASSTLDAPILARKDRDAASVFSPNTMMEEAQKQKSLAALSVPRVCLLDPDGDIVRWLSRTGRGSKSQTWACYHSDLYEFDLEGVLVGIVGCAVGAPFAVLVAEQMFAAGCELLISLTSAGQIARVAAPPYFVLIDRALRDEGTSYHYLAPSSFAAADDALLVEARTALQRAGCEVIEGGSWTTDAPFRETTTAVEAAKRQGLLAVEMESAALYAFALASQRSILCLAHVTNTMGQSEREFDKGQSDGVADALRLIGALIRIGQKTGSD